MPAWGKAEQPLRLRETDAAAREVLEELDQQSRSLDCAAKRKTERYRYRVRAVRFEVFGKDGSTSRYELPSRNISRGGMSLLIGQFVYPGLRCAVELVGLRNQRQTITGTIARCRYLTGSAHLYEVGIRYNKPIDVSNFYREGDQLRVLIAAGDAETQKIIQNVLDERAAESTFIETADAVLAEAQRAAHDLMLVDLDLPALNISTLMAGLRTGGYGGPVCALAGEIDDTARQSLGDAGCIAVLEKPLQEGALDDLIRTTCDLPVYSTLLHEPKLSEQIDTFVAQFPKRITVIELSLKRGDWPTIRQQCQQIAVNAGFCGFDAIRKAAELLEKCCVGSPVDEAETMSKAQGLILQCRSARPASIAPPTTRK